MYVTFRRQHGLYHVSLVSFHSRVAQLKSNSIPGLELQVSFLLRKLVDKVCKDLKIVLTITVNQ